MKIIHSYEEYSSLTTLANPLMMADAECYHGDACRLKCNAPATIIKKNHRESMRRSINITTETMFCYCDGLFRPNELAQTPEMSRCKLLFYDYRRPFAIQSLARHNEPLTSVYTNFP